MTVRVRFAPSPTGHLHIGSARTALFNYLFAKKHGGTYILRIEDTDISRNQADAEQKLIDGFRWLGLDWDEGPDVGGEFGPYRSMERVDRYKEHLDKLIHSGQAYPCFCTKEQLETERNQLIDEGKIPRYSGKCRDLHQDERLRLQEAGHSYTIRFRVPEEKNLAFCDHIRGEVSFQSEDVEDFVIVKSDGVPTYHFAVTVDDALMEITHVIRGEEHLSNTPKHLLLFEALGFKAPEFAHIPLILNPNGKKLSKRDETVVQFIEQYRELGYLPEGMNNYLALLGWSPPVEHGEQELFSMGHLQELFSLDRVSKSGAIFDIHKLAWMNGQYLKEMDLDRLVSLCEPYLPDAILQGDHARDIVQLFQTGIHALQDIRVLAEMFIGEKVEYSDEALEVLKGESVPVVFRTLLQKLEQLEDYQVDTIKQTLKGIQKETGFKGKALFLPIRVAATGELHGPDLNQTLYLLGREKVMKRIAKVLEG